MMLNIALVNESENEFDRIKRDFDFFNSIMEQNRDMERFVNESLILASGNKRAINEMAYITEAAAGDKIKGFFEKIKNFFKKIFDKLGASLNALFQEQKKYIEQYQFIITKCKWQVGDVSDIYDHFVGLPRIIDVADTGESAIFGTNMDYLKGNDITDAQFEKFMLSSKDSFASAEQITSKYNELKGEQEKTPEVIKAERFDRFLNEGQYWKTVEFKKVNDSNNNASVNESFKAWFNGSEDTVSYSGDQIEDNFQTIINGVYAGASYLTKLEKIVSVVNKKMDACEKMMEDYYKAQSEKIMKAVKQEVPKPEEQKQGDNNKIEITITKNGNKYTTELDGTSYTGTSEQDLINNIKKIEKYGDKNIIRKGDIVDSSSGGDGNTKTIVTKQDILGKIACPGNDDTKTAAGTFKFTGYGFTDKSSEEGQTKDQFATAIGGELDKSKYEFKNESTDVISNFRSYFTEAPTFGSSSGNGQNNGQNLTGHGNPQINNAGKTASNLSNTSVSDTSKLKGQEYNNTSGVTDANKSAIQKTAEDLLALDIRRHQTMVNADTMISTAMTTSMFNAFKLTNKDFFDIIKAHVQWYLSNPGAEKNTENQVSRPHQLDMSAGSVKKTTTPTTTPEQSGTGNNS